MAAELVHFGSRQAQAVRQTMPGAKELNELRERLFPEKYLRSKSKALLAKFIESVAGREMCGNELATAWKMAFELKEIYGQSEAEFVYNVEKHRFIKFITAAAPRLAGEAAAGAEIKEAVALLRADRDDEFL